MKIMPNIAVLTTKVLPEFGPMVILPQRPNQVALLFMVEVMPR